MRLAERVIVVTGAGRGNGRAIARRLADEGAVLVLGDIDEAGVAAVAEELREKGAQAHAQRCDVSDEDEAEALMARAEQLGGPHAVVAQAGVSFTGPLDTTSLAQWNWLFGVDVVGTFITVRAAVRAMMRRGAGGSIVTMSGTYAYTAEPGTAAHCASKAAILAFTRAVAAEYGDRGIRCNTIVPGYVLTEMVDELFDSLPDGEAAHAEIATWHALGRLAQPREVADVALFLCSDESSFCTGAPFVVDGGLTAGINSFQRPLARPA